MVTFINKNTRAKYAGDVLDNAPKKVQNGSVYFAMAEGKYYMYDAENDIWYEQADNGSGGGGEQVQSDWNQNDEAAPDYIKNKPALETKLDKPTALGTLGQFLVSDGVGGVMYKTVYNAEEVAY